MAEVGGIPEGWIEGRVTKMSLEQSRSERLSEVQLLTSFSSFLPFQRPALIAAVVRASAILRSQRGRTQPPARKTRGTGARKVVKVEEPTA